MVAKRITYTAVLLIGVIVFNFTLFFMSPGDPTNLYFSPKTRQANIEALKEKMGVDKPWTHQFIDWSKHILRGDLGYSWAKHRPVKEILGEAIPATLQLTVLAVLLNFVLGCMIGIIGGIHSERWLGKCIDTGTMILYSTPVFLLALFLIALFSLHWRLLPASGMSSLFLAKTGFWHQFADRLRHLALPVLVLGLTGAASISRYVQGHMQVVLKQDYIRMARAKGLSRQSIHVKHAFKNALIPVVTLLGLTFPFLLGSTLIVEVIFAWPGMGRVTYEAILSKDYPVVIAVNLIAAIMVILGNIVSDLLARWVDPRVRVR